MAFAPQKIESSRINQIIFLVIIFIPICLFGQTSTRNQVSLSLFEKKTIVSTDSTKQTYAISDSFLISNSELVWADSVLLEKDKDYSINYVAGMLNLKKKFPTNTRIKIQYQIFPVSLKRNYFHKQLIVKSEVDQNSEIDSNDSTNTQLKPRPVPQNVYSSKLRKSGSITRGITVGSNQDLQVDSGLRMQISGHLTENIEVIASLTDQNTPLQPEGNTQTLQEIDKVFVQIKGPNMRATLGDYNLLFQGTEFTRYNRKLQGAMGTVDFINMTITLSGAVSKGRFTSNEFMGREGIQGPYQLQGSEGQINILVLAGTERVWVDGELMTRGENHDYVIEYGNGQISFTRNRLITADSRITVDFQFSDESYQRNLWGARGESSLLNDKVKLSTTFIRESDDKDNPLSGRDFNDEFTRALVEAGDSLAMVPGWTFVGEDSGSYVMNSDSNFIYVGPKSGDYKVIFSDFGENNGDYRNIGLGRYEYVPKFQGKYQGRYRPFIILPQAKRHDVLGFNLDFSPNSAVNFKSELAVSKFDRNLFSTKDDGDNQGLAYSISFNVLPEKVSIAGHNLGRFELRSKLRRKNATFKDIDRTTQVEFNRRWNITNSVSPEETIGELHGLYSPVQGLSFEGGYGRLFKSSIFSSNRWEARANLKRKSLPKIDYFIENINKNDQNLMQGSSWLRQRARTDFQFKILKPIFDYEGEIRKDVQNDTSQLGFRFESYTAGLEMTPWKTMSASMKYNYRKDKDRIDGKFVPKSVAKTQSYTWALKNWHAVTAMASYTHRDRNFANLNIQNTRTDLADFRFGYSPRNAGIRSNLYYQISNTQIARQEEVFLEVKAGDGNFRLNEERNEFEPDPFGNYIRQIIPTKDFIPVIELKFRTDLRLAPKRFFNSKKDNRGFFEKIFSPITTESFLRIDERTKEKDVAKIYLLDLNHFQQDSTTIFGSIEVRQDVHLWENSRKLSFRYRFRNRQEKNNQFIGGGQDREVREQRFRLLNQFSKQISTQVEFIHSEEDRIFKSISREDRQVRSNELTIDFVYRPKQQLEIGLKSKLSFNRDVFHTPATRADFISVTPRSTYSLSRKGRFRGEFTWTKVSVAPKNRIIPFELTNGNRAGTSFRWNFGFDLRMSQNIQASFSYFGRSEPDRPKAQHFAKVEMRAFF